MEALQSLFCVCVLKEPMPGRTAQGGGKFTGRALAAKRGILGAASPVRQRAAKQTVGMQKNLRNSSLPLDKDGGSNYYNSYKTYQ